MSNNRRQYQRVRNSLEVAGTAAAASAEESEPRVGVPPRCHGWECVGVPKLVGRVASLVALVGFVVLIWPCASQDLKTLPCALLLVFVLLHYAPVALAFFITRLIQLLSRAERPPLTIGALHLHSWIRTGTLHMRLEIEDVGIRNPDADSKFSDEWFLKSQQLSLHCHYGFGTIWNLACGGCCALASPLSWTRRQARRGGEQKPENRDEDLSSPRPFGLINISHVELNQLTLNLEVSKTDGELNLCAFSRLADARSLGKVFKMRGTPGRLKVSVLSVSGLTTVADRLVLHVRGQEQSTELDRRLSSASSQNQLDEFSIDESFDFVEQNESAVLHIELRQSGGTGQQRDGLVGQVIIPLVDLVVNPHSCRHSGDLQVDRDSGEVRGCFPFRDSRFRQDGTIGSIQLKLLWESSEPSGSDDASAFTEPPAINQIGIMLADRRARNNGFDPTGFLQELPIRLLCDRLTVRNLILNIGALIPTESGGSYQHRRFSSAAGRYNGVPVRHLEATGRQLLPRRGTEQGMSVLQLAIKAGTSLAPEVMKVPELNEIFSYCMEEGILSSQSLAAQTHSLHSDQDDDTSIPWWAAQP
jgi:hypothetical protein